MPRFNNPDGLCNLVYEANTIQVAILPADTDLIDYLDNNNYLSYGYKSRKDYSVDYHQIPNGKYKIVIRPNKVYRLEDSNDIPQFDTPKSQSFLELMGDEFERIKLRAEWVLEYYSDAKDISVYANRQIQKTKKLFSEVKIELGDIQKEKARDNIYIFFVLNLFVARVIVFYQQMFLPYINTPLESKERLFYEIFQELSVPKMCKLFRYNLTSRPECFEKSFIENTGVSERILPQSVSESSKTFSDHMKTHLNTVNVQYQPIKLNGQVNVLVDIFTQLLEKYRTPEGPFIETSRENLEAFLVANFTDRSNKPLSSYTIHTLLKPYRVDKHIKQDSPKRIDISGFIEPDE
ncbi:MAG: hypothetical protein A2W93_11985 [Bacteroidetes bacterium GWF2_43_63]|nr:MAG: hypothetical protein A2W94_11655 [Bacteroidetes bacterium GWE2_42_42]OFY56345.1 MAG: hypothetical protein A2W93_11985 [Bacteroidetes bacterium GWF2_43_63]HBG69693.1 hypothetical protein [Bacteroidales bacterium]HCB61960.1 hypothetical protein [Bacteroidales bacterium]HCY42261.1 hypothetical protein [Prolixibacteraceae bacterium]